MAMAFALSRAVPLLLASFKAFSACCSGVSAVLIPKATLAASYLARATALAKKKNVVCQVQRDNYTKMSTAARQTPPPLQAHITKKQRKPARKRQKIICLLISHTHKKEMKGVSPRRFDLHGRIRLFRTVSQILQSDSMQIQERGYQLNAHAFMSQFMKQKMNGLSACSPSSVSLSVLSLQQQPSPQQTKRGGAVNDGHQNKNDEYLT